jgi:hypothetical protein
VSAKALVTDSIVREGKKASESVTRRIVRGEEGFGGCHAQDSERGRRFPSSITSDQIWSLANRITPAQDAADRGRFERSQAQGIQGTADSPQKVFTSSVEDATPYTDYRSQRGALARVFHVSLHPRKEATEMSAPREKIHPRHFLAALFFHFHSVQFFRLREASAK